jgi:Holliday junction resolvase-like predicted endonuclease
VRGTPQNLNLIHEKFVNLSGELDIDISFKKIIFTVETPINLF